MSLHGLLGDWYTPAEIEIINGCHDFLNHGEKGFYIEVHEIAELVAAGVERGRQDTQASIELAKSLLGKCLVGWPEGSWPHPDLPAEIYRRVSEALDGSLEYAGPLDPRVALREQGETP